MISLLDVYVRQKCIRKDALFDAIIGGFFGLPLEIGESSFTTNQPQLKYFSPLSEIEEETIAVKAVA